MFREFAFFLLGVLGVLAVGSPFAAGKDILMSREASVGVRPPGPPGRREGIPEQAGGRAERREGRHRPPRALHPAFYGCFDWHSSVHGHWMLVRLLRLFPDLPEKKQIRTVLASI